MPYYSHNEDDVHDFDEFDPTPYGGGYDIHLTYGRPLPPSEGTCYPPHADDFDYDRPLFSSCCEPNAYASEALDLEYSSYARPKPRPAPGGRPDSGYGVVYGHKHESGESEYGRRPEYEGGSQEEFGSGYGEPPRRPGYGRTEEEYEKPSYGRSEEEEGYLKPSYGRSEEEGYWKPSYGRSEEEEGYRKPSYGRPEEEEGYRKPSYGGSEEEEGYRKPSYGRSEEEEGYRKPSYGRSEEEEGYRKPSYGRSEEEEGYRKPSYERQHSRDDEDEDRPKYGYGQEEGYGRKKYVSIFAIFLAVLVFFSFFLMCVFVVSVNACDDLFSTCRFKLKSLNLEFSFHSCELLFVDIALFREMAFTLHYMC